MIHYKQLLIVILSILQAPDIIISDLDPELHLKRDELILDEKK